MYWIPTLKPTYPYTHENPYGYNGSLPNRHTTNDITHEYTRYTYTLTGFLPGYATLIVSLP
jgi:hypothetical protein